MTSLEALYAKHGLKFAEIEAASALQLGLGPLTGLSIEQRRAVLLEAERMAERWAEDKSMHANEKRCVQTLLAEYSVLSECILDALDENDLRSLKESNLWS